MITWMHGISMIPGSATNDQYCLCYDLVQGDEEGTFAIYLVGESIFYYVVSGDLLGRCPLWLIYLTNYRMLISQGTVWAVLQAMIFKDRHWMD